MKKIISIILLITICLCLTSCKIGNRQIGFDTKQTFKWTIIQLGNGELIEGPVDSWRDFSQSDVVQVTINGDTYLSHYSNIILCSTQP